MCQTKIQISCSRYKYIAPLFPKTIIEDLQGEDVEKWRLVGEYKISKLNNLDVYDLVELWKGEHLIGIRWVLVVRSNSIFRALKVAKGYSLRPVTNINPERTYC